MHISNVTVNGCQVLPVWTADCLKSKCAFKSKTLKAVFCLNISVHFYMAECVQFNLFQSKRFLYIDSVGFLHYVFFFWEWKKSATIKVCNTSFRREKHTRKAQRTKLVRQTLPKRVAKCVSSPFPIFQQLTSKAGNGHESTINEARFFRGILLRCWRLGLLEFPVPPLN